MNLTRTTFTIPESILESARIKAVSQKKSLSRYISEILAKELKIRAPKNLSVEEKMKALGTISSNKKSFVMPSRDEMYAERTRV